jgi:hypothetical protein
MKYSLTRLLLEDIKGRTLKADLMPSPAAVEKAYLLDIYAMLKKAAKGIVSAVSSEGIEILYTMSPDARRIIDRARAYVRRRDEETQALFADTSLETALVRDLGQSSTLSDDEKKRLAVCLGYYESVTPTIVYKWQRSSQSQDDFEAEIRLGVQELKLAAAIKSLGEIERFVSRENSKLRRAVDESVITTIRDKLGSKGAQFNIDLTEDPQIKPVLDALRKAEEEFEFQYEVEGKSSVFTDPTVEIIRPQTSGGPVTYTCPRAVNVARYTFNEGRERKARRVSRTLLEFLDGEDEPPEEEEEGARPPQSSTTASDPRDMQQAIDQLILRFPAARSIIARLETAGAQLTTQGIIDAVKPVEPRFTQITMSFLRDDGKITKQPLSTQGSVDINRSASGIIAYFLAGGRKPGITDVVADMVALDLGIRSGTGASVDLIALKSQLDRAGGFEALSEDARRAFYFVVAAVAEYSSAKERARKGSERVRERSFASFSSDALQTVLDYHAIMSALRREDPKNPAYAGEIEIDPGGVPDDADFVERMMRRIRGKPLRRRITTFKAFPVVGDAEEAEKASPFMAPPGGKAEAREHAEAVRNATSALKKLTGILGSDVPGDFRVATRILRMQSKQVFLPAINFSEKLAEIPSLLRMPDIFEMLGYETDALIARKERTARDVWLTLCDAAGARTAEARTVNEFSAARSYSKLREEMTGENLALAIKSLRIFYFAHFVSPLARLIAHAAQGYAERGLLTPGREGTLNDAMTMLGVAHDKAIKKISAVDLTVPVEVQLRKAGKGGRLETTTKILPSVNYPMDSVPNDLREIKLTDPLASPREKVPPIKAKKGAPLVADITKLGLAQPSASVAGEPPSTPDAEPPPDAPPGTPPAATSATPVAPPTPSSAPPVSGPPAPPPVAPPAAASTPAQVEFDIEASVIGRKLIDIKPARVSAELDPERVGIVEVDVQVAGGTEQAERARQKPGDFKVRVTGPIVLKVRSTTRSDSLSVSEVTLDGLVSEIRAMLDRNATSFPSGAVPSVKRVTVSPGAPTPAPSSDESGFGSIGPDDIES